VRWGQIIVTDREISVRIDLGVVLATTLHRLYASNIHIERLARLLGHPPTLEAIRAGNRWMKSKRSWASERELFRERREKVHALSIIKTPWLSASRAIATQPPLTFRPPRP
jgi:hypothetical protein